MAKRKRRKDEGKARHWAEVMAAWSGSGLTQEAFCKQQGIPFSTFQYWRYRRCVGQGDDAPRNPESRARRKPVEAGEEASVPAFVPVNVLAPAEPLRVAVVLTNGRRIEVSAEPDIDWLTKLVVALDSVPC